MKDDTATVKARAEAVGDQAWAAARSLFGDIERIAINGPSPEDAELIQFMACLIVGDLHMRAAETTEATP